MSSLLATKLHRPSIPPKRVQRPQLIQRLNEGLEAGRNLTLVSEPMGLGKTTCIGEWVNELGLPAAWILTLQSFTIIVNRRYLIYLPVILRNG